MNQQPSKKRIILAVALTAFFVFLLGAILSWESDNTNLDQFPEEGSAVDFSTQAYLYDADTLLVDLQGLRRFDSFAEDLHVFALKHYPKYSDGNTKVVGFQLHKGYSKAGDTIRFSGRFGATKNKIEVTLQLLDNERLKSSITDTKTGNNIDEELPSNSTVNKFLASLPIDEDEYRMEYAPNLDGGGVQITIYVRDPSLADAAKKQIVDAVGQEAAAKLKTSISFPPPSFFE